MRNSFVSIVSLVMALSAAMTVVNAAAQNQPPVLVITPTRFEQPVAEVVAPTRVITHREIEASGATTAADVLRFYPGFQVVQSGGIGQLTSVFLQGTNSNMVKVLINGIPVNDSTAGGAPWADIPIADIDRIEVVQGPLSTLWGSSAIGGVVNIITRHSAGTGGHLTIGWGNWDTHAGSLGLHKSGRHAAVGVTVSGKYTAGMPPVQDMSQGGAYADRTTTVYASLHSRGSYLRADLWRSRGRGAYATGYPPYTPLTLLSQRFLHQTAALRIGCLLGWGWRFKAGLQRTRNNFYQDQPEADNPGAYDFAEGIQDQLYTQLVYGAAGRQVLIGASHASTHAASLSYGTAYDNYRHTDAVYAEWQQQTRGWQLAAAVRRTDDSQFGGHDTWNLGVSHQLWNDAVLDLSAGTGYRSPTFNDLYGYGSNPGLKPEVSHSMQAGLHLGLGTGGQLHLSAYQQQIDDLIETVLVDPSTYRYQNLNVQHARIRGLTLGWSWLRGGMDLGLDATWQNPLNLSTGQRLLRRASQSYQARMTYDNGRWQLGSDWVYSGCRDDFGGQTLAAYMLGNFTVRLRINRAWTVKVSIDNLLNTNYVPAYYGTGMAYLGPTRSAMASVRYDFGNRL